MSTAHDGPADWLAADLRDPHERIIQWTPQQLAALDAALRSAVAAGIDIAHLTRENFALPGFEPLVAEVQDRLENGRGVVVLRGLPALDYTRDELRLMYWGLGLHLGTAVSRSSKGDSLGDVRNFGDDTFSSTGRGYLSRQHLGFHTGTADVGGLMVMRVAKSGGLGMIASSSRSATRSRGPGPTCSTTSRACDCCAKVWVTP